MKSPLVVFDRLSLWVGERQFLRNVELTVEEGERLLICGGPGSGKSFLLRLILGLPGMGRADEVRYSGAVRARGLSLLEAASGPLQQWRREVGAVLRGGCLIDNMDIRRNITLPLYYHCGELFSSEQIERRCSFLMELLGIGHLDQPGLRPVALDPEERVRAALARALIGQPCLLLLDDPVAGLGEEAAFRLLPFFSSRPEFDDGIQTHDRTETPFSCLVTTTDDRAYGDWADRRAALEGGSVRMIGTADRTDFYGDPDEG